VGVAAEDSFRAGDLGQALKDLQADIRKNPADPRLRVFLSQLLLLAGDWKRAHAQLQTLCELDAGAIPMVRTYQTLVQCEVFREQVFAGERSPLMLGEPEPWLGMMVQALAMSAAGHVAQAAALRAQALESAPVTAGTLNGTAFEWIADADSRLGPVLEVVVKGHYYWVPFTAIGRILVEPPSDARDMVFLPATFTWSNGGEAVGFIPTRYNGSHASSDDGVRMARKSTWQQLDESTYIGSGQRVLSTDAMEIGVLDLRELVMGAGA
jgi:type VI secretion system protein ImpE